MRIIRLLYFVLFICFFGCVSVALAQDDISKVNGLIDSSRQKNRTLDEAKKFAKDALTLADKFGLLKQKADALNQIGKINLKLGEYPEAMENFFEELQLREKNPGWGIASVANIYILIGETYRAIANYDLALEYLNKSLKVIDEKKENKESAFAYNRLAAVYYEIAYRQADTSASYTALDFANKSLEICKKINDFELTISNLNIVGAVYTFRKDFKQALNNFLLALNEADKDSTYPDRPNVLNNISNIYIILGEYDNAIKYASESYTLSKKSGIRIYVITATRALSDAYAKKNDYLNAFKYSYESYSLYISLFDERKSAEIYGIQKKYENELLEKEDNSRFTKRLIIGTATFLSLLFIGIIFYLRHRNQILLNKKLEKKNELISEQREELLKSNAAKDKFFSIISHDLKNPLHGILGFSNILDSDFDNIEDKEKKEYIGYLKSTSESMKLLIEKILTWSRVQSGNMNVEKERINLFAIVSENVEIYKANAIRKGIVLENNIHYDLFVDADNNILDTVIRNILDNAVKFTDAGGKVQVDADVTGNVVEISITDTGVGISESDIIDIFRIDKKVASPGTHDEKGTGLGLILCKELLELIGSKIKIESKISEGSKFSFTLPLYS